MPTGTELAGVGPPPGIADPNTSNNTASDTDTIVAPPLSRLCRRLREPQGPSKTDRAPSTRIVGGPLQ